MGITKRISILAAVIVVGGGAMLLSFHNCAPSRLAHQTFPPIGMPVQLKAPAEGSAAKSHGEYKNVLVYFVHGSESIDYSDQVKVQLFGTESQEPLAEYTGAQLKESYLATKCSDRLSRLLENAFLGDALFCEGSLNLSKVNKWVYVDGSGKKRSATSYILDYTQVEDDVIAVTVNFN